MKRDLVSRFSYVFHIPVILTAVFHKKSRLNSVLIQDIDYPRSVRRRAVIKGQVNNFSGIGFGECPALLFPFKRHLLIKL